MAVFRVRLPRPKVDDLVFSDTKLMRSIGAAIVGRIRERTERGVGPDGGSFRGYSAQYAKQKAAAVGNTAVNLTVSGGMLNGMIAKPTPKAVQVSFTGGGGSTARGGTFIQRSRSVGAAEKAFFHNVSGAGRSRVKREFFALSDDDENLILDMVDRFIAKQL